METAEIRIDRELVEQAARIGLNIEIIAERAARLALQRVEPAGAEERARRWSEQNTEAIKAHNEHIAKYGVFGEALRRR